MANIFDNIMSDLAARVAGYMQDALNVRYGILRSYTQGDHRKQLRSKEGQPDDNVIQNYVGLIVARSVSRLLKGGVDFSLPEGADEQQEYINDVWELNKKALLLYQLAYHGAVYGTPYVKIIPNGIIDPYTGKPFPRLIALDPDVIRIETDPQDMERVMEYRIEYSLIDDAGKTMSYREITARQENNTWLITFEVREGSAPWRKEKPDVTWGYDFPNILHWKNLPSLNSVLGNDDISDAINIQDKNNFVVSNNAKIVKHHAHPQTIGTGFSIKNMESLENAVGTFRAIPNPDAKVFNLEMNSDLASSRNLALDLRQSLFDIAREIDLSTVADKLGSLTNFGLHVLYTDAMNKNDTKRALYGDALNEINRRLLVLAGYLGEASRPGTVVFGEAMEINVMEELQADKLALDMGIIDAEGVAKRYESRYGETWEDIKERMEANKNEQENNIDRPAGNNLQGLQRGDGQDEDQDNSQAE